MVEESHANKWYDDKWHDNEWHDNEWYDDKSAQHALNQTLIDQGEHIQKLTVQVEVAQARAEAATARAEEVSNGSSSRSPHTPKPIFTDSQSATARQRSSSFLHTAMASTDIPEPHAEHARHDANEWSQQQEARCQTCIDQGVHTALFTERATPADFLAGAQHARETDIDGEASHGWLQRLESMNIPIANHAYKVGEWTLHDKLRSVAQLHNKTFTLDYHNGRSSRTNPYACTSIICNYCNAKLVVKHPHLPAKGGKTADDNTIRTVNAKLVQFLFTGDDIRKLKLLEPIRCTVERFFPGILAGNMNY